MSILLSRSRAGGGGTGYQCGTGVLRSCSKMRGYTIETFVCSAYDGGVY